MKGGYLPVVTVPAGYGHAFQDEISVVPRENEKAFDTYTYRFAVMSMNFLLGHK